MSAPGAAPAGRASAALPLLVLVALGAGWGLNQTLSKVATSTGHGHFGLLAAQCAVGTLLLGSALLARGRGHGLGVGARQLRVWVLLAAVGTVLPGVAYYQAVARLPAGIMALMMSLIPMMALPMAAIMGTERAEPLRLVGVTLGLAGVALIARPGAEGWAVAWVAVAAIAPMLWAVEGVGVARWGTAGLSPVEALFGANLVGLALSLPLAWGTGQLIDPRAAWGAAEWAILGAGAINAVVYSGYVWLVGRAGATFAAQVSYLVTGFGVLWAVALLGERYGPAAWGAMALMMAGLAFVQPRPSRPG